MCNKRGRFPYIDCEFVLGVQMFSVHLSGMICVVTQAVVLRTIKVGS
jgi:hypothetical protein